MYVGPYFKCVPTVEKVPVDRKVCLNPDCSEHDKEVRTPFCGRCGQVVGLKKFHEETTKQFPHDITYELKNTITAVIERNLHLFMVNEHRKGIRDFWEDLFPFEVENEIPRDETEWLMEKFFKEHERLLREYPSVKVVWGFIDND